ncbi:hypothetical protein BN946_scf184939.g67 [Trametes cinnabarina]|uniref:Galactose oxidase n=1 Tax=Pycnoporus cinnabarinus TaxID=5643 RepID=A0A060SHF8_PYCCI|nr:hypothetical protein BN946_scf184939.g67 [Trametes cinnabarina]
MHVLHEVALSTLLVISLVQEYAAAESYTAVPRWGQAVSLVDDVLFVHGGRTDQFNQYGYSTAPVNNDILILPLNASFDLSSPPWQYVSGCSDCPSSQGPAVAWHTLSAFNTTNLLLFGGDAGPNGPISEPEKADSAALLNVANREEPVWNLETASWANEPLRRIYHSASSTGGKIWLIGGEKADGSGNAFSDHYVYDPSGPTFTQLPSTNGPPDLFGHASIVLPDHRLIVFGGYSPSQGELLPFSTIWALDTTQSSLSWSSLSVSASDLPSPRRGFAAAILGDGRVLVQGGADADMQNVFSDGWVLDTTQNPMTWSAVDALSQVGPRRDHFAAALGSEVLFGFGFAQSAPVNASLLLFDASQGAFTGTYTPPPAVISPTSNTIPGPTATGSGSGSGQSASGSGDGVTGTRGGSSPSSTGKTGSGGNGSGSSGNGGGDGMTPSPDPAGASSKSHVTAVAVGVALGVLGLLAGGAAAWYLSTRHRGLSDSFHLLGPSDDDDSPHLGPVIPVVGAGTNRENVHPVVYNVRQKLGGLVSGRNSRTTHQPRRRDMLADEDTRVYDEPGWYQVRRDSSIGSWSTGHGRPTLGDMVQDSLTSLRNVGGAMLAYASGTRHSRDKEVSGASSTTYWEKDSVFEPYSDKAALVGLPGLPQAASRPKGGKKASYTSQWSYYEDPFAEYDVESFKLPVEEEYDSDAVELAHLPSLDDPPPRPYMYSRVAPATVDVTRLSPLSEEPSFLTATDPTASSDSSHGNSPLQQSSSADHARSSGDVSRSPRRPSSILDASPPITANMRRSDSWWSRFAKTPLLDRLSTDSSRAQRPLDFRDPNPPPRTLVPIKESSNSLSPEDPPSARGSRHDPMYASAHHGRSATSLQTSRTADSEVIEKMGRTMDIVQKGTVSSHASDASTDSGASAETYGHVATADHELGALTVSVPAGSDAASPRPENAGPSVDAPDLVLSPVEMSVTQAAGSPATGAEARPVPRGPRRPTPGTSVAARIAALEQHSRSPSPLPPSRPKKHRSSVYGLAPKPSLFVANPDRRSGSGNS